MKKLMLLAAMLAMVLAVAIPAVAQVGQGVGQESESGGVSGSASASNAGASSNLCPVVNQFGNSGNVQNGQGFAQQDTVTDDVELSGSTASFAPAVSAECSQTVQQAAAAG